MACAVGVQTTVGARAEARVGFVVLEDRALLVCLDFLCFSTPILRRLVERGSADAAWRFEPTAGSGVSVKIVPVRWNGEGWGRGTGKEKVDVKVLV